MDGFLSFRGQTRVGILVHEHVADVHAEGYFKVEGRDLVEVKRWHARPPLCDGLDQAMLQTGIKLSRLQGDRHSSEPRHGRAEDSPLDADLEALHVGEVMNGLLRMYDKRREGQHRQGVDLGKFARNHTLRVKTPQRESRFRVRLRLEWERRNIRFRELR